MKNIKFDKYIGLYILTLVFLYFVNGFLYLYEI